MRIEDSLKEFNKAIDELNEKMCELADLGAALVEDMKKLASKEVFQVRKTSKGLKRTNPIIKPGQNSAVSDRRLELMIAAFDRFGVSDRMLMDFVGKPFQEFTDADMNELIKVHNRLKDGEPIEDVFAPF